MNVALVPATSKVENVPIEKLAGNKALSEEEKVSEVSRQFEAVLLRQILGEGRKTIFRSKLMEDSTTSGIYQDMVTTQLADSISKSGSFGLARNLQAQLTEQALHSAAAGKKP